MPRSGVFPRLWGSRPAAHQPAGGVAEQYDLDGIVRLESEWQRSFLELRVMEEGGRPPGEGAAEAPPAFFRPWRPRPGPPARLVQSQPEPAFLPDPGGLPPAGAGPPAVAAAGQERRGVDCRQVWRRLRDPALPRAHRVVAWRLLHGSLMVNALRMRVCAQGHPGFSSVQACCPVCQAAGRPHQLETLTHVFMDCPGIAPALGWLLMVYAALTGDVAPRDPLILLADADWRWLPAYPVLWRRLRVLFLGCVWAARSAGSDGGPLGVVEAVVASMARGVRRDWLRVVSDVRAEAVGVVPTVWFRGRSPALSEAAFRRLWPDVGGWFHAEAGVRAVLVRLSPTWPVQVPVFGPAPAPGV